MKKKLLVVFMVVAILATMTTLMLSACNTNHSESSLDPIAKEDIKIGLITLHDENSTYDKNFIDSIKAAQQELGLTDAQVIIKSNVDESNDCYEAAADLADQGCNLIFADSFGHETFMIKAAKEFKDVQFFHATGTKAHTENLPNYHNAFAAIYEGRYLAGVVAGLKLQAMIAADPTTSTKVGYVGAWPYAEVKSGYTAWFLGVRSIVPTVTMEVTFTNSWYDTDLEKNAANTLIANGCSLISQHADSWGAPTACEVANVPNVSYNGSTVSKCPNTYLVSSKINWTPYFKHIINNAINGVATDKDYIGTIADGSVQLTTYGTACAEGTAAYIETIKAKLASGEIKVFDTSKFTVNGQKVTTYLADIDDMGDYVGETEVIKNGCFQESVYRSAPCFDLDIDGITIIDKA